MVTPVRMDGCADHMNKKPDLIIKKYHSQNLTMDRSGDCKTQ